MKAHDGGGGVFYQRKHVSYWNSFIPVLGKILNFINQSLEVKKSYFLFGRDFTNEPAMEEDIICPLETVCPCVFGPSSVKDESIEQEGNEWNSGV